MLKLIILENLNDAQKQAVEYIEGSLLVLAGAGSGKTRVLTYRIAYLIEQGVAPWHILAITFTNKAALEMRERVSRLVPAGIQASDLWVSTFHATCLRILRREITALGYDQNFVIYDSADQQTLLKDCFKELNIDNQRFAVRSIAAAISAAKNKLLDVVNYEEQAAAYPEQITAKIYRLYQQKLKSNHALDFDDLLMLTVQLFQQYPAVLAHYQERFKYILVDEYQDTNRVQYLLINMLARQHRNLCVVGDPNQSIYGWRGADISNILSFKQNYPEAKVIKLEQNYRSTQTVLDAANAVIVNNPKAGAELKEMQLWTALGVGQPVVVDCCETERGESFFVAEIISQEVQKGRSYRDCAVLYRTHAQSRAIEEGLITTNIPYAIVGGLKFYDRKEIKDLLAYLCLLINPRDAVNFKRVIKLQPGIGDVSVNKLLAYAVTRGVAGEQIVNEELDLITALNQANAIPSLSTKVRHSASQLAGMFNNLKKQMAYLSITEITAEILKQSGCQAALELENTVESRTRLENLQEFLTVTKEYDQQNEPGQLADFLAGVALISDQDKYNQNTNMVSLMTLHTAKGLEFPVVFLVGMEEGIFPHFRSLDSQTEMEEERRLCYVGITRAKAALYISHCWTRNLYGRTQSNRPSRFIAEIPANLISGGRDTCSTDTKTKNTRLNTVTKATKIAVPAFQLGDKIEHRKWGEGVIVAVQGAGLDSQLTIAFPQQGIKKVIAKYAPVKLKSD